jgi:hypothetical protein
MHKKVESERTKNLEGSVTVVSRLEAGLQYSLVSILGRRRDFPVHIVGTSSVAHPPSFRMGTRDILPEGRLRLKCDGTRWRTGGEVKGKQENGVGNQ